MDRETLAQKKARMINESYEFQCKWNYYVSQYGSIFQEAFINEYRARIQLVNILDGMYTLSEPLLSYKIDMLINYCYCDQDYMIYYFVLGLFYERLNMIYEALNIYNNILMYKYNYSYVLLRMADIYYELKRYYDALNYYLRVAKCDYDAIDRVRVKIECCENQMNNDRFH